MRISSCRVGALVWMIVIQSHFVLSLYEDQVGSFDWTKNLLGEVKFGIFQQLDRSHLILASHENVIASVWPKTGNFVWRQVQEENGVTLNVEAFGKGVASISGDAEKHPTIARMWNIQTGKLFWEVFLNDHSDGNSIGPYLESVSIDDETGKSLCILTSNNLISLSLEGTVRWKTQNQGWTQLISVKTSLFGISLTQGTLTISKIDAEDGSVTSTETVSIPSIEFIVVGKKALFMDSTHLHVLDLNHPNSNHHKFALHDLVGAFEGEISFGRLDGKKTNAFHLKTVEKSFLLDLSTETPKLSLSFPISEDESNVFAIENYGGKDYLARFSLQSSRGNAELFDLSLGSLLQAVPISTDFAQHGKVKQLFPGLFPKKDSSLGFRIVAVMEDLSVHLFREEGLVWSREEALSQIEQTSFVDLPIQSIFLKSDLEIDEQYLAERNIFENYVHRLLKHANIFKDLLLSLTQGQISQTTEEVATDKFGIRKIVVVSTKCGKVFGIDSQKGEIIWSRYFPNTQSVHTILLRSPASYSALSLLVASAGDKTILAYFDPVSGKFHNNSLFERNFSVIHTLKLPETSLHHTHFVLLIDSQLKVHAFPEEESDTKLAIEKPVTFFLFNEKTLNGFSIEKNENGHLVVLPSWVFPIPESEALLSVAQKSPIEKIASLGRVLGNRQVLYKYLNPNLAAILTLSTGSLKTLHVYLIDTISGALLNHQFHHHATAPVSAVVSEHWVVYQFWDEKERQHQVSVLELYESIEPDSRIEKENFSSYDGIIPDVLSQSYIFPTKITTMSVTQTKRGITSKELLFGLGSDQLFGVPKRFLDPRRHSGTQSTEDREEGLLPYDTLLPFNLKWVHSYNQTVARIRSIDAAPASLESTSLVIVYGLDVFFVRLQPSKSFDALTDEFPYSLLLLTVGGLFLAYVFAAQVSHRRDLDRQWK